MSERLTKASLKQKILFEFNQECRTLIESNRKLYDDLAEQYHDYVSYLPNRTLGTEEELKEINEFLNKEIERLRKRERILKKKVAKIKAKNAGKISEVKKEYPSFF